MYAHPFSPLKLQNDNVSFQDVAKKAVSGAKDAVKKVADTTAKAAKKAVSGAKDLAEKAVDGAKDIAEKAHDAVCKHPNLDDEPHVCMAEHITGCVSTCPNGIFIHL